MNNIIKGIVSSVLICCATDTVVSSSSSHYFFHELSMVSIYPEKYLNNSDFGFAMGFQPVKNKLVIGAPSVDKKGKVYICNMKDAAEVQEICCLERVYNLTEPTLGSKKRNQKFYMGSTVAATLDYFFTCAPLWNDWETVSRKLPKELDAVGTCFIFEEHNITIYSGIYEQVLASKSGLARPPYSTKRFLGGTGWTTLADEDNGLLLIVKTSLDGDIVFTSLAQPETKVKPMRTRMPIKMSTVFNFGFGLTSGKFFSNKTVYAFSMYTTRMEGVIDFLEYDSKRNELIMMNENIGNSEYTIHSKAIATMFGSVLTAAILNMDSYSDLLVGEPVRTEEDCVECGAFHVYTGGEMKTMKNRKALTVIGTGEFGRLGTAIASKDLDGDGKPELVVSAPYKDYGHGAVYILSGHEVYQKLLEHLQVTITDFKYIQIIQRPNLRTFGFSLQFSFDVDDNGCEELAVGSPGNGTAVLFKCIQAINITLSHTVMTMRKHDPNFIVEVCVNVEYPKNPEQIVADLLVTNSVIGEASNIPKPIFDVDLSCTNCPEKKSFCENVTVLLLDYGGDYTFTSQAKLHDKYAIYSPEFNKSRVLTSPHSKLESTITVSRRCKDDDCIPDLSVHVLWSGSNKSYELLSSENLKATIMIRNDGNSSYEACVYLQVEGAPLSKDHVLQYCSNYKNGYICQFLPKPIKRKSKRTMDLLLDMTKPTNEHDKLLIQATLYVKCYIESTINGTANISIPYIIPTDDVLINGTTHTKNITDSGIDFDFDEQEYLVINNGGVMWKHVIATISIEKRPYLYRFKVSTVADTTCKESYMDLKFISTCILYLSPNSTQKIIVTTGIYKKGIEKYLTDNKFYITSRIHLDLRPTNRTITETAISTIAYHKEYSILNNKWFIIIIAAAIALLILIVIFTILLRRGFFKRKQKQRLRVLRESFRQRSSRRSSLAPSTADKPTLKGVEEEDCALIQEPIPEVNRLVKIEEQPEFQN